MERYLCGSDPPVMCVFLIPCYGIQIKNPFSHTLNKGWDFLLVGFLFGFCLVGWLLGWLVFFLFWFLGKGECCLVYLFVLFLFFGNQVKIQKTREKYFLQSHLKFSYDFIVS